MIYLLYNVFLIIGIGVYLAFLAVGSLFSPLRWEDLKRRWGSIAGRPHISEETSIWIHAASVGEVQVAERLLAHLKNKGFSGSVLVSTMTKTGQELISRRLSGVQVIPFPLDLPWKVEQIFSAASPQCMVVVETEFWPNLFRLCRKRDLPLIIVNGRVSDESFRGYKMIRPLIKTLLSNVTFLGMQAEHYAKRAQVLGADSSRIRVTGNLKFDNPVFIEKSEAFCPPKSWKDFFAYPLFIAGSTRSGEDEIVVEAWKRVRKEIMDIRLILAPRHLERLPEIMTLLRKHNVVFSCWSQKEEGPKEWAEVMVLDTIGELAGMYRSADVVFVGGSLVPVGGHNLLEPAVWGKPVLFGPHVESVRTEAALLLESGLGRQVDDTEDLVQAIAHMLRQPGDMKTAFSRFSEAIRPHQGAGERTAEMMAPYV